MNEAQFTGSAKFDGTRFSGPAWFDGVHFSGPADFSRVEFSPLAHFTGARFAGPAHFGAVRFSDAAKFDQTEFSDYTTFDDARFSGHSDFSHAKFSLGVYFNLARFSTGAVFTAAQFSDTAEFDTVQFDGPVWFTAARFADRAWFDAAQFSDNAWFYETQFSGDAWFGTARFAGVSEMGPIVCAGEVNLSGAVFDAPVTLEIAARQVRCERTRWESTATLRLRYANVDLTDAVLSAPVAVVAHPAPFPASPQGTVDESLLAGCRGGVQVASVQGVDAAQLVLTDTDLTDCRFTGAFHLDQIHIEGRTTFASVPKGLHFRGPIWPVRWSQRRTLAEEHHWRAQVAGQPAISPQHPPTGQFWRVGPHHGDPARTPDCEDIAAVYRQLRKAFEDAKNEPGSADFYYGEMEMRRHSHDDTPRVERGLLHAYWLLSGYGLRASRAAGWLIAAMITTIVLLMGFGLPQNSPRQEASGTVPAGGGRVTFAIDKDEPQNPTHDRFTGKRFEKALNVTLNSVIFRSSGQDLTTTGTYIEMGSRLLEPALLALAVLAVRGRIKR
ncbi:pentapeptide repeat-containing protein [Streptomyces afghaniensis]|uniref:pentapeptide repeat-containing protein n=1 Tax=Streptomyces afghaniensis TaxID=66865 RepID=UPI0037A6BB1C